MSVPMLSRSLPKTVRCVSRLLTASTESPTSTHILIVHEGFPKTEFYAKKALSQEAVNFYNLPRSFEWELPKWLIPSKVSKCIEEYGRHGDVQETIMKPLASQLASSLHKVMPELESVEVSCASPFEEPTIQSTIGQILRKGTSRLIILPLQPHFACMRSGLLLHEAIRCIEKETLPSSEGKSIRVLTGSPYRTQVSAIERWSTHPVITNLWSSRLEKEFPSFEAVLFVAPVLRGLGKRDYETSVFASAERTVSETRVPLPWKVAFFNGWNQWDLPICESISMQLRHLKGRKVAVVPISSVAPSLDTISILPSILSWHPNTSLLAPQVNSILVQGLTETIKNHLLGRKSGQLQLDCCWRSDCRKTREMLC